MWATNFEISLDEEHWDDWDDDEDEDEDGDDGDHDAINGSGEPTLREILASDVALDRILNDEDDMFEERAQAIEWVREGMPGINFRRSESDSMLDDDVDEP